MASHPTLGERYLYCEGRVPLLFTDNETNFQRIFGTANVSRYLKDGINNYVIKKERDDINPGQMGTKAAAQYQLNNRFAQAIQTRQREADESYRAITPQSVSKDEARVMRQVLAGMLWSKQYFGFNLYEWLREHGIEAVAPRHGEMRNSDWFHMISDHIISMPDKWEYPWFAAWDLAFHAIALSTVDIDFAKQQLDLMFQEFYLHPTGQIPAYEWNFSDVNPPVHAWASIFLYRTEQALKGKGDLDFLERSFRKLLLNFSWWVNRKDRFGKNLFEGGFLGLDNIGAFDRSAPLPTGGHLEG